MTQLTADNETIKGPLAGNALVGELTVLDTEKMYVGGLMAVDYNDEAQMASDTAGLRVVGICNENVDNTDDGETVAPPLVGIYRLNNSATYPIPRSAIGQSAYVEDDNTVAGWSTNLVAAGIIHDVDSDGVWLDVRPEALRLARSRVPVKFVAKTDNYTVTAAIAFEGRTAFLCDKATAMEITLPTAVAGMRVGVQRTSATAAHDLSVQAAAGDTIEAGDGTTAAGKQIDNTVDAVSEILWLEAVDDTAWVIANPRPRDVASWAKNDA